MQARKAKDRFFGYGRMSKEQQTDSPRRQRELIIEAVKRLGGELIAIEIDEGVSSLKQLFVDRPAAGRLWKQLRRGDVLVVTALDRLGRSSADIKGIQVDLMRKGIGLRTLAHPELETINLARPTYIQDVVISIDGLVARGESERHSVRLKTALGLRKLAGEIYCRHPGYGYRQIRISAPVPGNPWRTLPARIDDAHEQQLVRYVWWLHLQGLSYTAITARLREEQEKTYVGQRPSKQWRRSVAQFGKPISRSSIGRIINWYGALIQAGTAPF